MSVRQASHPLDHPIWTALTTTQQALAEGDARARRYPTEMTPFADMPDLSAENFAALAAPDVAHGHRRAVHAGSRASAGRVQGRAGGTGEQMIGTPVETPANGVDIVTLGADDVPDDDRTDHAHQAGPVQHADP